MRFHSPGKDSQESARGVLTALGDTEAETGGDQYAVLCSPTHPRSFAVLGSAL